MALLTNIPPIYSNFRIDILKLRDCYRAVCDGLYSIYVSSGRHIVFE